MNEAPRLVRRRVRDLLRTALQMAVHRLVEDHLAPETIAQRTFVLIDEAASLSRRTYTATEAADVIARFLSAWDELTAVTHA